MKLEMNETVAEITTIIRVSPFPAIRIIFFARIFMIPVRLRPAPMIMTAIIETTAFELSPIMASSPVNTLDPQPIKNKKHNSQYEKAKYDQDVRC
jgi:hypothetical protein